mmetsp:Transcript_134818/g.288451  ORF Transcript_134818/g.288451 Transcript_134818/m.288451 type:complete len:374 (-) Transcript_134818:1064-2185(-)
MNPELLSALRDLRAPAIGSQGQEDENLDEAEEHRLQAPDLGLHIPFHVGWQAAGLLRLIVLLLPFLLLGLFLIVILIAILAVLAVILLFLLALLAFVLLRAILGLFGLLLRGLLTLLTLLFLGLLLLRLTVFARVLAAISLVRVAEAPHHGLRLIFDFWASGQDEASQSFLCHLSEGRGGSGLEAPKPHRSGYSEEVASAALEAIAQFGRGRACGILAEVEERRDPPGPLVARVLATDGVQELVGNGPKALLDAARGTACGRQGLEVFLGPIAECREGLGATGQAFLRELTHSATQRKLAERRHADVIIGVLVDDAMHLLWYSDVANPLHLSQGMCTRHELENDGALVALGSVIIGIVPDGGQDRQREATLTP